MNQIETEELADIDYPAHPEEHMSSSQFHSDYSAILVANLRRWYRERANEVAVFTDMAWYPIRGNNHEWRTPDVMVCFGVQQRKVRDRSSYAQHLEFGIPPSVVFEIDSKSNTEAEIEEKRAWYETYGVEEFYWIFTDPPEVRVFVREENHLVEQSAVYQWTSPMLGIRMEWSGIELQLFNPDRTLMRPTEEHAAILEERARLAEEHAREQQTRARLAEENAKKETEAREAAEKRAEQEAQRAEKLAAMLRQLGVDPDAPQQ